MSRRWKLVSGDYSVNDGSWEVEAADPEGKTSLVTYSVHAEPNTAVPDFLRAQAQKKALPELIARVGAFAFVSLILAANKHKLTSSNPIPSFVHH